MGDSAISAIKLQLEQNIAEAKLIAQKYNAAVSTVNSLSNELQRVSGAIQTLTKLYEEITGEKFAPLDKPVE